MAIFGLKSRKSYSSETASFNKQKPDSAATRDRNLEASDVIGESPDFGSFANSRRGPSHASDSSSLLSRNSSSMKKFFGSTRRKGSQSIDGGSPAGPPGKNLQTSDYFNDASSKRASRTSLNKPAATPASPPVITPSAIAPSLSSPTGAGGSFAEAVGQNVTGGLVAASTPSGPRPSELFAGKGVQWEQISLTARDITKPTDAANTTVDMQKFLKERRQWIPTFKDSETVEEASVNLPKSLEQFSFEHPAEVSKSSAGLKSLRDLEDTHKRKVALLNSEPLATTANGTIFEEAGPSTSVLTSESEAATSVKPGQSLPPPPVAPSRNQSFRTSTFVASNDSAARKSGSLSRKPAPSAGVNGNGAITSTAAASRDIPQRRSSVRRELSELGKSEADKSAASAVQADSAAEPSRPANGRVDQIKEQAGVPETARPGTAATGSVRPSMETAGFATPAESQSQDGEHLASSTLTQELPSTPPVTAQVASQDSANTVAPPISPSRPPKNGQRTPSRQNSKEPINNGVLNKPTDSEQGQATNLVQKIAQAAPALQNIVPGTGAATDHDA
ncbi:uncharacterized protein UTRI_06400 [Ustilago trichophora]|uniref:Uncharacterized protein n=1 Tax=Ustilago trichophora TaxID=86804 RepID=A0A5C3EK87_9BASI|nr:uncharacterized protein UTRI_06400 [Ustilago trichophora]